MDEKYSRSWLARNSSVLVRCNHPVEGVIALGGL
jgi:hypothetical protein